MTTEPIAEVVARVLARDATGEWMDRDDAVTLAREVARLTETNRQLGASLYRYDNEAMPAERRRSLDAEAEVARLRDRIEVLRRDYEWAMHDSVVEILDALLAPTTGTDSR